MRRASVLVGLLLVLVPLGILPTSEADTLHRNSFMLHDSVVNATVNGTYSFDPITLRCDWYAEYRTGATPTVYLGFTMRLNFGPQCMPILTILNVTSSTQAVFSAGNYYMYVQAGGSPNVWESMTWYWNGNTDSAPWGLEEDGGYYAPWYSDWVVDGPSAWHGWINRGCPNPNWVCGDEIKAQSRARFAWIFEPTDVTIYYEANPYAHWAFPHSDPDALCRASVGGDPQYASGAKDCVFVWRPL